MRNLSVAVFVSLGLSASSVSAQFPLTEISALGGPPLLLTKQSGWQWEDISSQVPDPTYNIYRRAPAEDFMCLQSGIASPSLMVDPDAGPPAGIAWWYSVNGDDGCDENMHGNLLPISDPCRTSGCPACRLTPVPGTSLALELFASGLSSPVYLTAPPDDVARVFVVEQRGDIELLDRDSGTPLGTFLDITSLLATGSEQGLLSMAFHPDYATNGRFYVFYTATDDGAVVEEYTVSADPDVADPGSGRVLLEVAEPRTNHNGGQVAFGPTDRQLYVSLGDGGKQNDPDNNAQRLNTMLGKILRIDVDGGIPYGIPAGNPFVGMPGALEEIWSYGLRNPWRFSFDRANGDLYVGDVGQNCYEEVSVGLFANGGGENYGWNPLEGEHCRAQPCGGTTLCAGCAAVPDCSMMTMPAVEIRQSDAPRSRSVIGGFVYRGCRLPDLVGTYFYSDWDGSFVRSFALVGGLPTDPIDWSASMPEVNSPSSFGQDADGEIYIMNLGGDVYRIVPR